MIGPTKKRNLTMYFVSSMKDNRLFEILDEKVLKEGNTKLLKEVFILAKKRLMVKGYERPTIYEGSCNGTRGIKNIGNTYLGEG